MEKVVIIVGPTSVGKTELSLILAEKLNGEIVSADSRQIFRFMDIGTDKPSADIQETIPHYMIDVANPDEYYSAGKYSREARKAIETIISKGRLPIVAGGAGLYIRALTDGIFPEVKKDYNLKTELRKKAESEGIEHLYNYLKEIDPETASRLSTTDTQRIIRAVEVFKVEGKPLSDLMKTKALPFEYTPVYIGLSRERPKLYRRIEKRVDSMIERGFVDEVKKLREMGYHGNLDSMRAVGYRELNQYLEGEITLDHAINLIKQKSRNYAKRQITWFKKNEKIRWFNIKNNEKMEDIVKNIIKTID